MLADRDVTAPDLGDKTADASPRPGAVTALRRAAGRSLGGSLVADAPRGLAAEETMVHA